MSASIIFQRLLFTTGVGSVEAVALVPRAELAGFGGDVILAYAPRAGAALVGAGANQILATAPVAGFAGMAFDNGLLAMAPSGDAEISGRQMMGVPVLPALSTLSGVHPYPVVDLLAGTNAVLQAVSPAAVALVGYTAEFVMGTAPRAWGTLIQLPTEEGYAEAYMTTSPYLSMWGGHHSVDWNEGVALGAAITIGFVETLWERLGVQAQHRDLLHTAIELEDTLVVRDTLQLIQRIVLAEALALADEAGSVRQVVVSIVNELALAGIAQTQLDAHVAIATALVVGDPLQLSWLVEFVETMGLDANLSMVRSIMSELTEGLGASAPVATILATVVDLTQALGVGDGAVVALMAELAEVLGADGDISSKIRSIAAMLEHLIVADVAESTLYVTFTLAETLVAGLDAGSQLTAGVVLREALGCHGVLVLGGEVWNCWLINTESKGVGRYTNYPFNSFARTPWGTYVGATDTGLHELGGDDDDGEPINAVIRSALTDFGDRHAKRVPTMYIGYTSGNQVGLKVVSTSEAGHKTEDHYLLEPRDATAPRESRFKVGRGIASVYLGFEIVNIDGADLELDVVEWLPLRLSRRVR